MLAKDTTDRDGIWTLEPMKIGTSLSTEPLARLSSVLMGCAEEREYREGDVFFRRETLRTAFTSSRKGGSRWKRTCHSGGKLTVHELTAHDVLGWSWLFARLTFGTSKRR